MYDSKVYQVKVLVLMFYCITYNNVFVLVH